MSTDLEILLQAYWKAKNEATAAAEKLADVQAAIVALMPKKDEGTVTQQIGDAKATVTYSINRTGNNMDLKAMWVELPANAQSCFAWKASAAIKEMRAAQQMDASAYAASSQFITSAPAKPSLKIERK